MSEEPAEDPLPCPFCGNTDIYVGRGGVDAPCVDPSGTWGFIAGCTDKRGCGAVVAGPGLPDGFHRMKPEEFRACHPPLRRETVKRWNRRAPVSGRA